MDKALFLASVAPVTASPFFNSSLILAKIFADNCLAFKVLSSFLLIVSKSLAWPGNKPPFLPNGSNF